MALRERETLRPVSLGMRTTEKPSGRLLLHLIWNLQIQIRSVSIDLKVPCRTSWVGLVQQEIHAGLFCKRRALQCN